MCVENKIRKKSDGTVFSDDESKGWKDCFQQNIYFVMNCHYYFSFLAFMAAFVDTVTDAVVEEEFVSAFSSFSDG